MYCWVVANARLGRQDSGRFDPIPVEVLDKETGNRPASLTFNKLIQGFMGLGLLVGVAGAPRHQRAGVVEHRQQIGVMRAIGFRTRMVQAAFLLESSFVALTSIVVGTALAPPARLEHDSATSARSRRSAQISVTSGASIPRRAGSRPGGWLGAGRAGADGLSRMTGCSCETVRASPWCAISSGSPSTQRVGRRLLRHLHPRRRPRNMQPEREPLEPRRAGAART